MLLSHSAYGGELCNIFYIYKLFCLLTVEVQEVPNLTHRTPKFHIYPMIIKVSNRQLEQISAVSDMDKAFLKRLLRITFVQVFSTQAATEAH